MSTRRPATPGRTAPCEQGPSLSMDVETTIQAFANAGNDLPQEAAEWALDHWEDVAPETDGCGFCFVTHALSYNVSAPREGARLHQRGCPSYRSRFRRCARRFRFCRPMITAAAPYPTAKDARA